MLTPPGTLATPVQSSTVNAGCPGMSRHGPMYPIPELSLAEMPPFHKGLCSVPQPGPGRHP